MTNMKHPPPPKPVVQANEGGAIQYPNKNDVLSGRGGRINNHEGNIRFRNLVKSVKLKYLSKDTKKLDKAWIAADIVDQIRNLDPPGRFLKEDQESGFWYEVGDERARRKTGQALREDAPDIREELEEEEKKQYVSMMPGPYGMMPPINPGMYPYPPMPYGGIYPYPPQPQMYPQYGQFPGAPGMIPQMPQAPQMQHQVGIPPVAQMQQPSMPQAQSPFNPMANPMAPQFMYPQQASMMLPQPTVPNTALPIGNMANTQISPNDQKQIFDSENQPTSTTNATVTGSGSSKNSNFTGISDISADTKLLALMGNSINQDKPDSKDDTNTSTNSVPALPLNTSQNSKTKPPVSSLNSTLSQLTTSTQGMLLDNLSNSLMGSKKENDNDQNPLTNISEMNTDNHPCDNSESTSSSYHQNIQVPLKDSSQERSQSKSKRNEWRNKIKNAQRQAFPSNLLSDKHLSGDDEELLQSTTIPFLPTEEATDALTKFNNKNSNQSASSSKNNANMRVSNNYLFSSSVISELSLASQKFLDGKDPHQSFRKSMSMTDLDMASASLKDVRELSNRSIGGEDDMCHHSAVMERSMASSTGSSWMKGFNNSVASEFNPWVNESSRSVFSDISMDLLALDLAHSTNGGRSSAIANFVMDHNSNVTAKRQGV